MRLAVIQLRPKLSTSFPYAQNLRQQRIIKLDPDSHWDEPPKFDIKTIYLR